MKRVIDFLMGKQGRGAASDSGATLVDRESYQQLKTAFDTTFELLEDNFSKEHPDKHYLSSALKFKLPGTEHIDGTKQEVTFSTYNTLFARTSADFMQRHGLGNVSLNVLQDPAKLTL